VDFGLLRTEWNRMQLHAGNSQDGE
jgi:hypothetical protein